MDATNFIGKWSTSIAVITTISGGAAWLTTTRNDVHHLSSKVIYMQKEMDTFVRDSHHKRNINDSRLSRIEAKLDMILNHMKRKN
jgi:hypothetical protein